MFKRPVGKQRSRAFMMSIGAFGIVLMLITFYIGYTAANKVPGRKYYNVTAQFKNAENLSPHYEIREGGVRVGQVLNPRVVHGLATVNMRLDKKYGPLKDDTLLRVRLRSAVGVRYLEIIPGKSGKPVPDGGKLPVRAGQAPAALDQSLGGSKDRNAFKTFQNELAVGVMGRGTDVNQAIASGPGFLNELRDISNSITHRPGKIMSHLVTGADTSAQTFDAPRYDAANGFDPEKRALAPFNEGRSDVQKTLETGGPTLGGLSRNLPGVSRLLSEAYRFASDTRGTFRVAPSSLSAATGLLKDASEPLGNANDTLKLAGKAVSPTLGLLDSIQPSLAPVSRFFNDATPTLQYLEPRVCNMTEFFTSWANFEKLGDARNNFIRFYLPLGPQSFTGFTGNTANGGIFLDSNHLDAYSNNMCNFNDKHTGWGVMGYEQPTEQESIAKETYSKDNLPGAATNAYGPDVNLQGKNNGR